jgi:hypothetical protein
VTPAPVVSYSPDYFTLTWLTGNVISAYFSTVGQFRATLQSGAEVNAYSAPTVNCGIAFAVVFGAATNTAVSPLAQNVPLTAEPQFIYLSTSKTITVTTAPCEVVFNFNSLVFNGILLSNPAPLWSFDIHQVGAGFDDD